jgi:tetratricopeptide (TPR) repeat protein
MLFRLCLWALVLAASGALVGGCGSSRTDATPSREKSVATSPSSKRSSGRKTSAEDLATAHAHYASAVIHEMNGEADEALGEYTAAATNDLSDEELLLDVSRRLVVAKQPEKAIELLTRATARPTATAALYAQLGGVYSRLGQTDRAIAANRAAIRKDPARLDGYRNLFVIYLQNQKTADALNVLDEAAKVPGTNEEFLVGLGELYVNFGYQFPAQREATFNKASAVLLRGQKQNSDDPELLLKLADLLNVIGRGDDAAKIYQDLIKRLANVPYVRESIRAKLADIYLGNSDRTNAAEQLEAIVRDNPTDWKAFYALGVVECDDQHYPRAIECFNRTMLLNPDYETAYFKLVETQIYADKGSEALETLEKVRQKFPARRRSFLTEYLAGLACRQEKDYTNAIGHFTSAEITARAVETNRLTEAFYFQFGATCERQGDLEQAEKCFQKCLELSPNFAEAQNYLGYMWAEHGTNLDRAHDLIEKALKSEPKNDAYLDSMAWVLFKLNRPKDALNYILKAVENAEEEDATVYDHLGDIYQALGQSDKAQEAWRKSVSLEANEEVRKKIKPATK